MATKTETTSSILNPHTDDTPSVADEHMEMERRQKADLRKRQQALQKLDEHFRRVLGTESGQEVLAYIIFDLGGGLGRPSAADQFMQGQRNVGLTLLEKCAVGNATATVSMIEKRARHGR